MTNQTSHEPAKRTTVCGIIGIVFGGLGVLLSFIPIVNNFAAILGAVGVVLAVIALIGTFRGKKHGKALAVIAAVLSVLAIVITLAMQAATVKAIDDALGTDSTSSQTKQDDADSSDTADDAADDASAGEQDMEGDIDSGNYHVKLISVVKGGADYEGKPAAVLTFELTNNKTENSNFMDYTVKAFQNGKQLDTAIFMDAPEGYDSGSSMTELQPGATGTVTLGYVLEDDSPVTIEADGTLDMSDAKVTHVFDLQ